MQEVVVTTSNGSTTTDTLNYYYDGNGQPLSITYNGTTYYYVTNAQGDVMALVDTTGATVATYSYDAWGNILATTGNNPVALANSLRYRSYVYDSETEYYYLQSRYYNPEIGRFLNADANAATGQGQIGCNMFAYGASALLDTVGSGVVGGMAAYSDDIPIMYPAYKTGGRQNLTDTIEQMSQITTAEQCMQYHKKIREKSLEFVNGDWETNLAERGGTQQISELIWLDKSRYYDSCLKCLYHILEHSLKEEQEILLHHQNKVFAVRQREKYNIPRLEETRLQIRVLENGEREENLAEFKKITGIPVPEF